MKRTLFFLLFTSVLFVLLLYKLASFKESNFEATTSNSDESVSSEEVSVVLAGDTMLGRTVMLKSLELADPLYPFRKIAPILQDADVTFVNLENPVILGCSQQSRGYKFCTSPEMAKGLVYAGVDVVNLANNHSHNFGKTGFTETVETLTGLGVESVGYGNLVIKEVGGLGFGFMGYDFVTNGYDFDPMPILDANEKVDVLIVGVHWGEEYKSQANSFQIAAAEKLVTVGADVVVGHHPHWVQNSEHIGGKPVFYSLGNLVFDQMWSEETKKGMVVKLTFTRHKLIKEDKMYTYMSSWSQPEIVSE